MAPGTKFGVSNDIIVPIVSEARDFSRARALYCY